jgi:hypothetical protein
MQATGSWAMQVYACRLRQEILECRLVAAGLGKSRQVYASRPRQEILDYMSICCWGLAMHVYASLDKWADISNSWNANLILLDISKNPSSAGAVWGMLAQTL